LEYVEFTSMYLYVSEVNSLNTEEVLPFITVTAVRTSKDVANFKQYVDGRGSSTEACQKL
jgi:hypothetical protein